MIAFSFQGFDDIQYKQYLIQKYLLYRQMLEPDSHGTYRTYNRDKGLLTFFDFVTLSGADVAPRYLQNAQFSNFQALSELGCRGTHSLRGQYRSSWWQPYKPLYRVLYGKINPKISLDNRDESESVYLMLKSFALKRE